MPDHDRCNALTKAGHDVVLVDWSIASDYVWKQRDKALYRFEVVDARARSPLGRVRSLLQLLATCWRSAPDTALIYGYNDVALFLVAMLLLLRRTAVLSMNDSKFDDYRRRWLADLSKVIMLAPYGGFIAATRRAADYLYYLTGKQRMAVYHCAIDIEPFVAAAESARGAVEFDQREFIVVGRFIAKKNHLKLLDMYERYAQSVDRPRRLRVIGYGELEAALRERIARSELLARLVTVDGYVAPADLPAILARGLALLLPSTEEQFGIVVTEALAAGIPVLVSPACGATDIVSAQVNGFVIDPADEPGWAEAMRQVAGDEARWLEMSRNAGASAQRADVRVFVGAVESLSRRVDTSQVVATNMSP